MLISSMIFLLGAVASMVWMFPVVEEKRSQFVFLFILLVTFGVTNWFHVAVIGWLVILILIDLYVLFYARIYEHFIKYCILQIGVFILILGSLSFYRQGELIELLPILFLSTMYLIQLSLKMRVRVGLFIGIIFFTTVFFYLGVMRYKYLMLLCTLFFLAFIESLYSGLSKSFIKNTKEFQKEVMLHHYEEVKSIYLNMRGWRHDYHNHIQTMKAILALKHYDRVGKYLGELEVDLAQVDNLIKSGNLMVDAILNSKLSLAKQHGIKITCKAMVSENIRVSDIDICVIIGNLLDNAMEACHQIEKEKRFIRIYGDIVQSQFYFSVLNSASENLTFNQKNYISEKRGEHGHGLKRVKLTVDKYEGYIKLRNESGVFASEIMIPL